MLGRHSTSRLGARETLRSAGIGGSRKAPSVDKEVAGVEGTLGAVGCGCFRERPWATALTGAPWLLHGRCGESGELILQGFRKESSEGLVSGQSLQARFFQRAGNIGKRLRVSGSIGLG